MESVGLFYRYVTPVHPWILYLLYSESPNVQLPSIDTSAIGGASAASLLPAAASNADLLSPPHVSPTFFTVFLCILYVIFKINQIYNGLNEVVRSLRELLGNFVSFFFFYFFSYYITFHFVVFYKTKFKILMNLLFFISL